MSVFMKASWYYALIRVTVLSADERSASAVGFQKPRITWQIVHVMKVHVPFSWILGLLMLAGWLLTGNCRTHLPGSMLYEDSEILNFIEVWPTVIEILKQRISRHSGVRRRSEATNKQIADTSNNTKQPSSNHSNKDFGAMKTETTPFTRLARLNISTCFWKNLRGPFWARLRWYSFP